jgi:hypothetical protein
MEAFLIEAFGLKFMRQVKFIMYLNEEGENL